MDQGQAGRIDAVAGVPRDTRKRLGRWLTLDELKTLLAAPPPTTPNRGMRDRTALWIMGACGLRREEAAGLRLRHLQTRDGRPALIDFVGKGDKLRSVPVHQLAALAIRKWCDHAGIVDPEAFLLPTFRNPDTITAKQSDGARLYAACVRYCDAFDREFRPHDLRRTFAVLCRKGGADLEEIRRALGHSSVMTTEIYLRGPMSMESAATDRIKF
jgi:integrase